MIKAHKLRSGGGGCNRLHVNFPSLLATFSLAMLIGISAQLSGVSK